MSHVTVKAAFSALEDLAVKHIETLFTSEKLEPGQRSDLLAWFLWDFHGAARGLEEAERVEILAPTPRRAVPTAVRERVYDRDGRRCLACGTTEALTIDHVVPLDLGGRHAEDNFQTLCRPCNAKKGATAVDYRETEPSTVPAPWPSLGR